MTRKIAFASDHVAYEGRDKVSSIIREAGAEFEPVYLGPFSSGPVDYPDYAEKVCLAVCNGEVERGILLCGTGIGMSIAANKVHGIRAALCHDQTTARLTREHNNSNVLCIGYSVVGAEVLRDIITTYLTTDFPGEERHRIRVDKVMEIEKKN